MPPAIRLRRSDTNVPGIRRRRRGKGFEYLDADGKRQSVSSDDVNAYLRELTGAGLSRQSWALRPKLLEANAIWERHPGLLFEAHPEVSFRTMAGTPLTHPDLAAFHRAACDVEKLIQSVGPK